MKNLITLSLVYLVPLATIISVYLVKKKRNHRSSSEHLEQSTNDGLIHAASLHPIIDASLCIGCGSCVSACPEQNVLGLIDRHATLINPTNCIGHGACKDACPQEAIKLVFGSATRGLEIPNVSPLYETCVKGIFIAGELGGMGLIRNAIEQGRLAMDSINNYIKVFNKKNKQSINVIDSIIIGAGPAGMTATLGAVEHKLKTITIDQDTKGGTIAHFPKGKVVMTQAAKMPLVGNINFGEISKEKLMTFWLKIINKYKLNINESEALLSITQTDTGLHKIKTSKNEYLSKTVLLALGRRGTPRKLDVPGEKQSKVTYRLADAEQYKGQSVLIVGGGDSALEAACSIAEQENTSVTLSYRKDSFGRAKQKNRERVNTLEAQSSLKVIFNSQVKAIGKDSVLISAKEEVIELSNQAVIVCVGGILPTGLLKELGVKVETKYGTE